MIKFITALLLIFAQLSGCSDTSAAPTENLAEQILTCTESVAEEVTESGYESGFSKPVSLTGILENGKCNNAMFISAVLQEAGALDEGEYIAFTAPDGEDGATKTTLQKAVLNADNIDESLFTMYEVGTTISEMPEEYLVPGSIFVWDSNLGIYMEDGSVWSLPDASENLGYCYRHNVLYAIVPDT